MKRLLLFSLIAFLLGACRQSQSPKETAQTFIEALYQSDLTTAASLVSTATKGVLDKAQKQTTATMTPEDAFQFSALAESVNGNKADVKNGIIALSLVNEDGWKVELTEAVLRQVQNREKSLSLIKTKWEELQKEYEARMALAKEYVNYKKGQGSLSPQAKALDQQLAGAIPPTEWSKESLLSFVQKQQPLTSAIDAALEPSQAANTDMSMNYFLQLSNAGDRIKYAEGAYQLVAEKAQSPVYVPLPFKATNSLKVNNN